MRRVLASMMMICGVCLPVVSQSATPTRAPNQQPVAHTESRGEQAFKANCSRCHTAPAQMTPRIAGTVLMHMRVRASLSAADEKEILRYLAP
jgi:cytochrome c5